MSSDHPPRVRNISELAQLAGVSAGTVSRALANKALVNQETRERIQALAREHGFRPNQMARRLRTQETKVIGIVVPLGHDRRQRLSDPFFMAMLAPLIDELTDRGYDAMLSRVVPSDPDWLEHIVDSGMLDAVALIGQSDQFDAIEKVAQRYRPMVVWGSHQDGQEQCTVGSDNVVGGRMAGEMLIARGCKRIAFLGDTSPLEFRDRHAGLTQACTAAGIAPPLVVPVPVAAEGMADAIRAALSGPISQIDGIACASDLLAAQTVRLLADLGLSVPDDVAVVGYDDLPLAEHSVPRISTISQQVDRGAKALIETLFARLRGEDAPSVIIPPAPVRRETA